MSGVYLKNEITEDIKKQFYQMSNVKDLASLLNFVEKHLYQPKEEIYQITFSHLYYLSRSKDSRYKNFQISKKDGSSREISAPDKQLLRVQTILNVILQIIFKESVPYSSNGFLLNRDIKRNAKPHVGKRFVLNIDIKDFFPSINFRRVKVVLELSPFNLKDNREKIAFIIANLSTKEGFLPQGAPTSPILSNIVTQNLDRKILKFCLSQKVKYTRYADDLSFSTNHKILNEIFITEIEKILVSENFELNKKKTRLRDKTCSQEVTGLIVNEKVNISREFLQKTRAMLNNWEKGGLKYAELIFKQHQPKNKETYNFKNVLLGNLSFISLIKGDNNSVVWNLKRKFHSLENLVDYSFIKEDKLRKRLQEDNKKMEMFFLDSKEGDENFISYCTSAFHQIENLINYFYWKKFPNYDDLLLELLNQNPKFKSRYKDFNIAKNSFSKLNKLQINVLVFLFEKDFFFDKKISYDKHLTLLREIRNDESHRCSVMDIDRNKIIEDYKNLKKGLTKGIKEVQLERIELNYKTLKFLEQKNYKKVRSDLKLMAFNIRMYFTASENSSKYSIKIK